MDDIDRQLLSLLQADATRPYAALGQAVGLSAGAAHERVRKLRERGVIRSTVADVDPVQVGKGVLAFILVFLAVVGVVRKVRNLSRRWTDAHIPVIVVSGQDARTSATLAGAESYFEKPCLPDALLREAQRVYAQSRRKLD